MKNREKSISTHNYAKFCIIMHATEVSLFRYLCLLLTKTHIKFQSNRIGSFWEKMDQKDKQTNRLTVGVSYTGLSLRFFTFIFFNHIWCRDDKIRKKISKIWFQKKVLTILLYGAEMHLFLPETPLKYTCLLNLIFSQKT